MPRPWKAREHILSWMSTNQHCNFGRVPKGLARNIRKRANALRAIRPYFLPVWMND